MAQISASGRALFALANANGAALSAGSAAACSVDFDVRSGGNAPLDLTAMFELLCQWGTVTGIGAGTLVASLYLVPLIDGTNLPDVDLTAGAARLPTNAWVTGFEASLAPNASTNMRFAGLIVPLHPVLYRAYLLNTSGQAISANWSLRVVSAQGAST